MNKKYYCAVENGAEEIVWGIGLSKQFALKDAKKNFYDYSSDRAVNDNFKVYQCTQQVYNTINGTEEISVNIFNENFPYKLENGIMVLDLALLPDETLSGRIEKSKNLIKRTLKERETIVTEILRNQIAIMEKLSIGR